mmetsp:Transcript_37988/g.92080  ORF Transcript_37988/g.92080 Transcript_37988/m.92080 type:complete len:87 (-) Transcript_37988:381-641(-)
MNGKPRRLTEEWKHQLPNETAGIHVPTDLTLHTILQCQRISGLVPCLVRYSSWIPAPTPAPIRQKSCIDDDDDLIDPNSLTFSSNS